MKVQRNGYYPLISTYEGELVNIFRFEDSLIYKASNDQLIQDSIIENKDNQLIQDSVIENEDSYILGSDD
ncbi:19537_t:CDS:2 [Dentiscutata erythropus]|uniref:19537_t:CDS:1 n=1 Tax=Dentiscutata erythropus TaxID=1348616 RepID=A0A9N8ZI59_9GLOM|nr:19537_t:CDS:2 [Dentiscutata erythropus]